MRRAFLCGGKYEHRRGWIESHLAELCDIFAIRPAGYAILSNHLHLVIKIEPDVARRWPALEVARRWMRLFPKQLQQARENAGGGEKGDAAADQYLENLAAYPVWIDTCRTRLSSLSWLHRLLKQPISRRANAEDGCTGHFWEGRFKSYRLLDEGALLAATVYVDLNQWRAGMISDLADSEFSSLLLRLQQMEARRRAKKRNKASTRRRRKAKGRSVREMLGAKLISTQRLFGMTTREYVSLVARTAGVPIDEVDHKLRLRALGIDDTRWLEVLRSTARLYGSVVGGAIGCINEANRRGARHVVNTLDVFDSG